MILSFVCAFLAVCYLLYTQRAMRDELKTAYRRLDECKAIKHRLNQSISLSEREVLELKEEVRDYKKSLEDCLNQKD